MLKATERAQGKRSDLNFVPNKNEVPTLSEIGIDRKVSMLAQQIAGRLGKILRTSAKNFKMEVLKKPESLRTLRSAVN